MYFYHPISYFKHQLSLEPSLLCHERYQQVSSFPLRWLSFVPYELVRSRHLNDQQLMLLYKIMSVTNGESTGNISL